jgi:repressor LexA
MAVTRRQKEVLDFLESFVTRNGYSPSFEEIARGLDLKSWPRCTSTSPTWKRKGCSTACTIAAAPSMWCRPGTRTRTSERLPLMGRIAAGLPVEAAKQREHLAA